MKILLATIVLSLTLAGCQNARDTRMANGALIGGAGGAVIGGVASNSVGGAVVGGVAGAAAGAVIADATRPRGHERYCYWDHYNRRVCRYR
jgi:nitrous oxide reductase accessory protein NosL